MNQNRKEELLTRWMDDALGDEERHEMETLLAAHPELEREREEYLKFRDDLREAVPAEMEPPYPDFFNVHLERLVRESDRSGGSSVETPAKAGAGLSRFWTWWMAPAATAALVAAFVAGMKLTGPGVVPAPVAAVNATALYSPLENVMVEAVTDEDLNATVIVLTGLDEIADEDLVGWRDPSVPTPGFFVTSDNTL